MVVQARRQAGGWDSEETFVPVRGVRSTRMVLATVAEKGWTVWQLEVQSACLHKDVDESKGYVKKAPEYETEYETTGTYAGHNASQIALPLEAKSQYLVWNH